MGQRWVRATQRVEDTDDIVMESYATTPRRLCRIEVVSIVHMGGALLRNHAALAFGEGDALCMAEPRRNVT